MKKLLPFLILMMLFFFFCFFTIENYASTISQDLENQFFRLHILANSDSKGDQELKLKVRNNIIEYMNNQNFENKKDAIYYVQNHEKDFYTIAENTIKENGYDYSVNIEIGNFYFPTKYYGNLSLPAGFYDGIKINLGKAEGQNWWCSLFPPLCFVDISSGIIAEDDLEELENNLSKDEFKLITDSNSNIKFKFKLIEILNKQ